MSAKSSRRRSTNTATSSTKTPRLATKTRIVALHLICDTADCDKGLKAERLSVRNYWWSVRLRKQWYARLQCPTCGCLRILTLELAT